VVAFRIAVDLPRRADRLSGIYGVLDMGHADHAAEQGAVVTTPQQIDPAPDQLDVALAQAYQLVKDENRRTQARWHLDISTGVYEDAWRVLIQNHKRSFSAGGVLLPTLNDVVGQWQQWLESQNEVGQ
jgi:hypothetical protein